MPPVTLGGHRSPSQVVGRAPCAYRKQIASHDVDGGWIFLSGLQITSGASEIVQVDFAPRVAWGEASAHHVATAAPARQRNLPRHSYGLTLTVAFKCVTVRCPDLSYSM